MGLVIVVKGRRMFFLVSLLAYASMIILAITFYFLSEGKIKPITIKYQLIQLFGCVFISLDAFLKGAYPPALLQIVCILISLKTIKKIIDKKTKEIESRL